MARFLLFISNALFAVLKATMSLDVMIETRRFACFEMKRIVIFSCCLGSKVLNHWMSLLMTRICALICDWNGESPCWLFLRNLSLNRSHHRHSLLTPLRVQSITLRPHTHTLSFYGMDVASFRFLLSLSYHTAHLFPLFCLTHYHLWYWALLDSVAEATLLRNSTLLATSYEHLICDVFLVCEIVCLFWSLIQHQYSLFVWSQVHL